MATHGKDAVIFAGGYDLSAFFNDATIDMSAEANETPNFAMAGKEFKKSAQRDASFSASGLFGGAAAAVDERLDAAVTSETAVPITYMWYGDVAGRSGYGLTALQSDYTVTSPADNVVTVSMSADSTVGGERVICLLAAVAATANTDYTSQDHGAQTTAGGSGYLQITAYSGFTSVTVSIEDSDTDAYGGEENIFSFTAATAIGAERITIGTASVLERYVRASVAVAGSGSVTFQVAYHRTQ